jgi:hypothetical protein
MVVADDTMLAQFATCSLKHDVDLRLVSTVSRFGSNRRRPDAVQSRYSHRLIGSELCGAGGEYGRTAPFALAS